MHERSACPVHLAVVHAARHASGACESGDSSSRGLRGAGGLGGLLWRPARLVRAVYDASDALSGTIAGFALLAGSRPFSFAALLAWREPVWGGAALVLLGLIGWSRWWWRQCGK